MVSSSPEYSITKPGLHHHSRKRDKPVRTYGRQQASTAETQNEPPLKKQRSLSLQRHQEKSTSSADNADGVTKSDDAAVAAASKEKTKQDATTSKPGPDTQSQKKVSILSYFQPAAPHKPKDDASSQPQDSQPEEPAAPQSSPKRRHTLKRKPRLLKIKAVTHDGSDECSQEPEPEPEPEPRLSRHPSPNSALRSAETPSSGSTSPSSSSGRPSHSRIPIKPPSKTRAPSIQTTLNISAQAAFSECKICDTVWNPLYPDDVKFHNKTHKAVLRAHKRKLDDL